MSRISPLTGPIAAVRVCRRPEPEYRLGHIAGAVSAPLAALASMVVALPRRREVVAYCRGPYCVYADEAVSELTRRGFRAGRLIDGFPEWKRAGLPVAATRAGCPSRC